MYIQICFYKFFVILNYTYCRKNKPKIIALAKIKLHSKELQLKMRIGTKKEYGKIIIFQDLVL